MRTVRNPDPRKHVALAMATIPGLVHLSVGLAMSPGEGGRLFGTGPSPALGLVAPGNGFYWLKIDPAFIVESSESVQPIMRDVVRAFTGEVMLGALVEPTAIVLLAEFTDTGPLERLLANPEVQAGATGSRTLADGTSLEVTPELLKLAGKDAHVLHVEIVPGGGVAEVFAALGLVPEGWIFAGGRYAAMVWGAPKEVMEKIATHTGAGMTPDGLRALPKLLAQRMVDEDVALMMHLPLDGVHSPHVVAVLDRLAAQMSGADLPPGLSLSQVGAMSRAFMSPFSGVSVWVGSPKQRIIVHAALQLVGDPRTKEGKAAILAAASVNEGGDPAAAWGKLATRYAGSDRITTYETRAGKRNDGVLASLAMFAVLVGSFEAAGLGK